MSLPNRIEAYDDCFDAFQQALDDLVGARFKFSSRNEAGFFMLRMQQARSLQREQSKRLFAPTDLRWGKSEFDKLMVRQPREDTEGYWWVYVDRPGGEVLGIELLSNLQDAQPALTAPFIEGEVVNEVEK